MIKNYDEFVAKLLKAGFSMGGGNDGGIFTVIPYGWNAQEEGPLRWHSDDPETDPWQWRMRVLEERQDIAYGKVFFRKGGYITQELSPFFIAARRKGRNFEDAYQDGLMSDFSRRIFNLLKREGPLPAHDIRRLGGFGKEEARKFEGALVDLQMGLFINICGRRRKRSKTGEEYGWHSTVLCTAEEFWGEEIFNQAEKVSPEEASSRILERIMRLNPQAQEAKALKFIRG
ncbi:MAG: AlkZ-related protein [Christensenellales bacterium]|jgi:hypothetical protein